MIEGLKIIGKRIRIKNSMVMRVRMKENLKPIEEEDSIIGDDAMEEIVAAVAEDEKEDVNEEDHGEQEHQDEQKHPDYSNDFNESVASQMDMELKRCLGLLTDEQMDEKPRKVSVDACVQADIGDEPLQLLPKEVIRTKALERKLQNVSVSSTDGNSTQDRSHMPWHQVTSTPALLQGKSEAASQLHQELTPIMPASGTSSLAEKTNNSGSISKRTGSLERSLRLSRGSTGSQRSARPQRPTKRLRSRESRSSRSSRSSRTTGRGSVQALKADSAPETETSMDRTSSSDVFSSDPPPRHLDTTMSASDSEINRRGDYGKHNIAQFLSSIQTPETPLRSKSTSRSWRYDTLERRASERTIDRFSNSGKKLKIAEKYN